MYEDQYRSHSQGVNIEVGSWKIEREEARSRSKTAGGWIVDKTRAYFFEHVMRK